MNQIPIGTAGERKILVTPEVMTDFLDGAGAQVLSTPHMIAFMEWTARDAIKGILGPGWDSVGTIVNVRHLAATPEGLSVTFRARVTGVEGRRVKFWVEAEDEKEKIGEGEHERFVVEVSRFAVKLAQKKESLA